MESIRLLLSKPFNFAFHYLAPSQLKVPEFHSANNNALPAPYRKWFSKLRAVTLQSPIRPGDYETIASGINSAYQDIKPFLQGRHDKDGEYTFIGMFPAYCYPNGETDKTTDAGNFAYLFAYLDDIMDDSTDIEEILTVCAGLKKAVMDPHSPPPEDGVVQPEVYRKISSFFASTKWRPEALTFVQSNMLKFIEHTIACRRHEIEQRYMWLNEYQVSRAFNVGMTVVHSMHWYADPTLDLRALKDQDALDAIMFSGASTGYQLDMYCQNIDRPNKTAYTCLHPIVCNTLGLSPEEGLNKVVEIFSRSEERFAAAVKSLSSRFPKEAAAIRNTHYNNMRWSLEATCRYRQRGAEGQPHQESP